MTSHNARAIVFLSVPASPAPAHTAPTEDDASLAAVPIEGTVTYAGPRRPSRC